MLGLLPTANGAPVRSEAVDITFDGRGDHLLGLGLLNGLLRVVTLGIYGPWAKTRVRERLWSFTRLNGEPLQYTGTGWELFSGIILVALLFILPLAIFGVVIGALFPGREELLAAYQIVLIAISFFLFGIARYRAQRYRLSRTSWRGIRGALVGRSRHYGWTAFWTLALPVIAIALLAGAVAAATGPSVGGGILIFGALTVFWVMPWRANKLQSIITNDTRFGDQPLTYSGTSGPLYKNYLYAWFGSIIAVGLSFAGAVQILIAEGVFEGIMAGLRVLPSWSALLKIYGLFVAAAIAVGLFTATYRAAQTRHFAANTGFSGATFQSSATAKGVAWVVVGNWLLWVAGMLAGLAIAAILIYVTGVGIEAAAQTEPLPPSPELPTERANPLLALLVVTPILACVTATTTYAQYRAAQYYTSRLKLVGGIDLDRVLQSPASAPRRGEGLAQVLDVDAF